MGVSNAATKSEILLFKNKILYFDNFDFKKSELKFKLCKLSKSHWTIQFRFKKTRKILEKNDKYNYKRFWWAQAAEISSAISTKEEQKPCKPILSTIREFVMDFTCSLRSVLFMVIKCIFFHLHRTMWSKVHIWDRVEIPHISNLLVTCEVNEDVQQNKKKHRR